MQRGARLAGLRVRPRPGTLATLLAITLLVLGAAELVRVRHADATPNFARKYGADCAMCHYPVVPRLNSFGQQFRRAGYRTPAEFNKDQDLMKVGDFLAARMRAQFAYENTEGTVERSEFRFPDVSLFYSGAISRNFSAWVHVFASNSTNVDVHGHLQGIYGKPDQFVSVRVGQMHMLQQEGIGGFDRPTGITLSPTQSVVLTSTSALTGGTAEKFNFDLRQKGVELAYVRGRGRLLLQISNGLDQNGSGTANAGDIDPDKDYLVAYDHILDDIASGFTLFYYHGTTHAGTPLIPPNTPNLSQQFDFSRYGFNLSKIFALEGLGFFELQGGYVRSYDNNPASVITGQADRDIQGNAFYVESQQYITGPELTFYERYSWIDPNTDQSHDTQQYVTAGVVTPVQTWLRATAEYNYVYNRLTGITSNSLLLELQANW
jgi:hypothetical protein